MTNHLLPFVHQSTVITRAHESGTCLTLSSKHAILLSHFPFVNDLHLSKLKGHSKSLDPVQLGLKV